MTRARAVRWACVAAAALGLGLLAVAATPEVGADRLLAAPQAEPGNWLTYSGDYSGRRHSPLTQIHVGNVARLRPVWVYQYRERAKVQTSPLVIDGILYLTEGPYIVTALEARGGRALWSTRFDAKGGARGCCGKPNRGLAALDDALFHVTFDGRLMAIDRRSGKPRWEVTVADHRSGYSLTGAPLALPGRIIVGVAGGDFGIRGHLDAYDPQTGRLLWRFWTVPGPGEPGHESWAGDSWKTGGAPTYVTGTYDPKTHTLYWTTGNPGPDWNGDERAGNNLYSDSLLALDPDNGKLKWHFQFTPHDVHDWDATQVPVLVDTTDGTGTRRLVATANRNGFFYVIDRDTGRFVAGRPYVRQNWAQGLDANGRPIALPESAPTPEGTLVYPGGSGGTNWFSPSYSPATGLFYVNAIDDHPQVFHKMRTPYRAGRAFEGGATVDLPGHEPSGSIKALDALTGETRWSFALHSPSYAGLLSTAGGVVFGGTGEGHFIALDAKCSPLWSFQTGGQITANPVTFMVDGRQHVAIASAGALFVFALD